MADQDYDPSPYDGKEWADGHRYGIWRPAVKFSDHNLISQSQNDQLSMEFDRKHLARFLIDQSYSNHNSVIT